MSTRVHSHCRHPSIPLSLSSCKKNTVWRDILGHMQSMIHESDPKFLKHYIELLRPVFVYILCNPTDHLPESCKQQAWHLLIKSPESSDLQLEILQRLSTKTPNSCIDTSNRILELSEYSITGKNDELCQSLVPLVAAVILELLKHNSDPKPNILMLKTMIDYADAAVGTTVMFLLSEITEITPCVHLPSITQIGSMILQKGICDEISSYAFLSSILPWMAYACQLSSEGLSTAKLLITSITSKTDWPKLVAPTTNRFSPVIRQCSPNYQFYGTICHHLTTESDRSTISWLERLLLTPGNVILTFKHVLSGLFLQAMNSEIVLRALKGLIRIAKDSPDTAPNILSVILHKLTKVKDIAETKDILFAVPELAVSKENIPTIIHVVKTLTSSEPVLKYLAIELYLKLREVEPRCHRYLVSALISLSDDDSSFMGTVTCANAMKIICERYPEHGAELVPLLSQIFNRCTNQTGSAASALALRGISALCVAGITDVYSTWRVLSPRMNEERRTVVISSICEFFGDVPSASPYLEEEVHELMEESLRKLWSFACHENKEIVRAAFQALASYKIHDMRVAYLPVSFTSHLSKSDEKKIGEGDLQNVQELTYVPGSCWIKMLENIRGQAMEAAGDFLIKFITEELYGYKSGIYTWSMGEPLNYKYLPDKSLAGSIGEYLRRAANKSSIQAVVVECMRIFSKKYPKALPIIQFHLFNDAINISEETRSYGVSLACHQAAVSPSAKEYLSKLLGEVSDCNSMNSEEFQKAWHLCTHLEDICRSASSSVLGPFLEAIINCIVERAIVNNENAVSMFNEVMKRCANVLHDDLVLHDNKTIIGNILEKLGEKVDVDHKIYQSIVGAMLALPTEQIERMTLPSVWEEITTEKLEKAIEIRGGLVLKRDNEIPLSWMNEILRVSSTLPSVHGRLLKTLQRILRDLRHEKSNADWTWSLMYRIQVTILGTDDDQAIKVAEFMCDALFVTIIVLACDDCLLRDEGAIATSSGIRGELFPHAVYRIVQMPGWKNITQQIIEWLHVVRSSCLSAMYKSIFHNALSSLKNEKYLNEQWTRYFSVKSPLSIVVPSND
uniref:Kiaa1797 protein n=1 Tax=Fopius arisanus TaxID=64838 RepID=A0A0C9QBD0_9HYME